MKPAIFIILTTVSLTGCDSIGRQLAKVLPHKAKSESSHLDPAEDGQFVDPTAIGDSKDTTVPIDQITGGDIGNINGDPTRDANYRQMMSNIDEPGEQLGAFAGQGEYAPAMKVDEPGLNGSEVDPTSEYRNQVGVFNVPDTSEGADLTAQYINSAGVADPALSGEAGQDPTKQYLGTAVPGVGVQADGPSQKKPNPQGAPPKRQLPSALRQKGTTNSTKSIKEAPPKATVSQQKNIRIGIPGDVKPTYASFEDVEATAQLLERGTAMSFGVNLQQTRQLPMAGTIYWVIHSKRSGFSRFEIPIRNGELPPRLQGVVPQFSPTSGPFRTFLVLVDVDNQVKYLTGAKEVVWNP